MGAGLILMSKLGSSQQSTFQGLKYSRKGKGKVV